MRKIAAIVSAVALLADLITVVLFIRDLLQRSVTLESAASQVALIVIVFAFAFLLLYYSRKSETGLNGLIRTFNWLYVICSAVMCGVISFISLMTESSYGPGEFLGYLVLAVLVAGLGYSVALFLKQHTGYFSVPFMLVVLGQVALWVALFFSQRSVSSGWIIAGNLLLFVIESALVAFFIWNEHVIERVFK